MSNHKLAHSIYVWPRLTKKCSLQGFFFPWRQSLCQKSKTLIDSFHRYWSSKNPAIQFGKDILICNLNFCRLNWEKKLSGSIYKYNSFISSYIWCGCIPYMIQKHLWQVSTSLSLNGYAWPHPIKSCNLRCFLCLDTISLQKNVRHWLITFRDIDNHQILQSD